MPMKRASLIVTALFVGLAAGRTESPLDQNSAKGAAGSSASGGSLEQGLVGYWKLQGDCRDYSGRGNHGVNHGVNLDDGAFDGISNYIEVPASSSLRLGIGDFALSVWIYTQKDLDDVVG